MPGSPLFAPLELGALKLRNRVAMAPMTRELAPGGVPTQAMADYYARRAAGGTALIITEGATPNAVGSFGASVPRFYGTDALAGWRRVADAVHAEGAAIFAQLWHVGAFSPAMIGMPDSLPEGQARLSPSGLAAPGKRWGYAMTEGDIAGTIADFAAAAAAAQAIGFDGVEIHGAHGYLPDQFIWHGTNTRTDRYGGSTSANVRFSADIVCAIKLATAADFLVSFRLSQWKQLDYTAKVAETPRQLASIIEPLADAGVDAFHCSTRRFWEPEFIGDTRNLAGWVRALSGRPVITVGSVTLDTDFKALDGKRHAGIAGEHIALLERGIAAGDFDMVAIGRALLANPDWVRLVEHGRQDRLRPFERSMLDSLD